MGGPRIIRHRHDIADIMLKTEVKMYINVKCLKAYRLSKFIFLYQNLPIFDVLY
jgi:hypothetical protein